jgi:predicted RNA-binding Zn ribbon-like protein
VSLGVNQQNAYAGAMRLSEKYAVPERLALLYDFVNSLDRRRYVEEGKPHIGSDELVTAAQLGAWMRARSLAVGAVSSMEHEDALRLRQMLRSFLRIDPAERGVAEAARDLSDIALVFPLVVDLDQAGRVSLQPKTGSSKLGLVLAQFFELAASEGLHRLKMCASEECEWVFFDRSKPGNRRWCSSARCGNREKTRAYRERHRSSR